MTDCQLFGLDPAGHHATSVLLHGANAAMVFLLLARTTGSRGRSLAAALFAVHPLRVESVSWIAERKDVLCGTFFLLALLAYVRYARRPGPGRFAVVLVAHGLGLMAKTMIVTLPGVLLLMDVWPLGRLRWSRRTPTAAGDDGTATGPESVPTYGWARLLAEKVPFAALAVVASAWTVVLQDEGEALAAGAHLTAGQRVGNAFVSIARYLGKTVRPIDLAVLYPHPGWWPTWQVAAAAVLVAGLTAGAVVWARRRPYLAVGWFWFLGMLVPVLGLAVQSGDQAMADRYTYLPSIGLTAALVWAAADLTAGQPRLRAARAPAAAVLLVILSAATWVQQRYWRDTRTVVEHALDVDPDNWLAHQVLGIELLAGRDSVAGIDHFLAASRSLRAAGRPGDAARMCQTLAAKIPGRADILTELGSAQADGGHPAEADAAFAGANRLAPADPAVLAEWGRGLLATGRPAEAGRRLREAQQLMPADADLRRQINEDLARTGFP